MGKNMSNQQVSEFKAQINKAFKELRKHGVIALQNYKCCQNCGWAAMTDEVSKRVASGKTVTGQVFYHRQDAESLKSGYVYLAWSSSGDDTETNEVFGKMVSNIIDEFTDCEVIWGGSETSRIRIQYVAHEQPELPPEVDGIPNYVISELGRVRAGGKVNMFDRSGVISLTFGQAHGWLTNNKERYMDALNVMGKAQS